MTSIARIQNFTARQFLNANNVEGQHFAAVRMSGRSSPGPLRTYALLSSSSLEVAGASLTQSPPLMHCSRSMQILNFAASPIVFHHFAGPGPIDCASNPGSFCTRIREYSDLGGDCP